ncbi:flagellar hook-associated protein FlgK [Thermodesulfobacterium hydrogeniphilum]|uniref:flagellar hook-associated protein FlgK n=1 Tax=Thermodesulfobacterium hydrogeniphilum TaxID=161156 RepID=UPI00056F9FAE|nr:flagellar hook-associated protein FlgK [Thermodesulfobacterium hydrogeniphilum]
MAGLTGALNIAKNSLLTFQTALQTISHNIANVNNENYSRQKVVETTYPPSPSPVGPIGSGVKIETIKRYFDSFLERNINLKFTDFGLYSAEESGLTILESIFNEIKDESGLSKLLQNFWNSWQALADNPENLAARTQVVENGKLITEIFKTKFQSLKDLENQIGLKLKTLVDRINNIASEISKLNIQITAMESGGKSANDLRDQRDALIKELSQLASIQYFETKEGAFNVIIGKGFNLVNIDRTWKLEISGTDLYWVSTNGAEIPLTSKEISSGELGGWLRLLEQLSDEYNYEYVSGNKVVVNSTTGNLISEDDKLSEFGLSGTVSFTINGTDHFGNNINQTISFDLTTNPDTTVRDLLDKIEEAYNFTVKAYIKNGRLFIEDQFRGPGKLSFSISGSSQLDFGSFDDPAFQRRVTELNLAGKLKLFGEELIKAVNELHTQGVGLTFYEKELEGAYSANQYIKELPYFLDLKKDSTGNNLAGFFYIWIKDPAGKITPVKVDLDGLSINSTLDDLANQINSALNEAGFYTNSTTWDIRAYIRNGKLVFQVQDGYAFGFSNDTSGILLSTGINLFFNGDDPASVEVNPFLIQKPELIATGKMDITAFRSERPLFGIFKSNNTVNASQTFAIDRIYLKYYNNKGENIPIFTENPNQEKFFFVLKNNITENTKLTDLGFREGDTITFSGGLHDGTLVSSTSFTIDSFSTVQDLINQIKTAFNNKININIKNGLLVFEDETTGSNNFTLTISSNNTSAFETNFGPEYRWDIDSNIGYYVEIPINSSLSATPDTLADISSKIDRLPYIRSYIDTTGYLVMTLEHDQTTAYGFEIGENYIGSDTINYSDSFVQLLNNQQMYIPAFRWDGTSNPTRVITGFEGIPLDVNNNDYIHFYLFDKNGEPIEDIDIDGDGNPDPFRINLDNLDNIFSLLKEINNPKNVQYGLSACLDREGRFIVETTGLYDTKTFIVQDEIETASNTYVQAPNNLGLINYLKGYEFKRGDNRTAQSIADLSSTTREKLNYSSLEDYYASMVGEIGAVTKSVKENKNFLDTLISQLKAIKDSISGVSLDEEMSNLIKYQQAFMASAKILSTVEDMFEALINAKR